MLLFDKRSTRRGKLGMSSRLAAWTLLMGTAPFLFFSICAAQQKSTAPKSTPFPALIDQAKKLIQSGDPLGALSVLQRADVPGTSASDVHTLRGICFAMTAKPIESIVEFDRAIALRPNYAPTYFSAGLAAASFNNLNRAEEMLAKALHLDPALPGVRYNYALVLGRDAKYAESEQQVDIELASKSQRAVIPVELWRLKARDAYSQKKWQETIDAYGKVLELQPNWPEAYAAVGEALYSLNRLPQSERALRKAMALDPEDGNSHETLGKLYQDEGKLDDAIVQFEAAIRLMPGNREPIYRLLRIYSRKSDTADAARLQNELRDLAANNMTQSLDETKATAFNNSGIELEKAGNYAEALDNYDKAAKTDVTNIIFQRNAALLLCKMGRPQEAIRRLRDILSLDSDDPETLQILAVANELASGQLENKKNLPAPQSSH
jgi:tetratricopeptide (TPR) repeat protein